MSAHRCSQAVSPHHLRKPYLGKGKGKAQSRPLHNSPKLRFGACYLWFGRPEPLKGSGIGYLVALSEPDDMGHRIRTAAAKLSKAVRFSFKSEAKTKGTNHMRSCTGLKDEMSEVSLDIPTPHGMNK